MKKKISIIASIPVLLLFVLGIYLFPAFIKINPLMGGADLHIFSNTKKIPENFNTHCFFDLDSLPSDSSDILFSYVGWRDPEYFISFSASQKSIRKYVLTEAKTDIENLKPYQHSAPKWVNRGPLDRNANPLKHPLWDLNSVKKGKMFEDDLHCIIIDTENNRVYDARATM